MDDEDNKKPNLRKKKDKQEAPSPDGENFESSLKKVFLNYLEQLLSSILKAIFLMIIARSTKYLFLLASRLMLGRILALLEIKPKWA